MAGTHDGDDGGRRSLGDDPLPDVILPPTPDVPGRHTAHVTHRHDAEGDTAEVAGEDPGPAADAPAEPTDATRDRRPPGPAWPDGYVPPASPAYAHGTDRGQAAPPRPSPADSRAPVGGWEEAAAPAGQGGPGPGHEPPDRRRQAGRLLFAGVAACFAVVALVAVASLSGSRTTPTAVGEVTEVGEGTIVTTDGGSRPLRQGDPLTEGSTVRTPTGSALTVALGRGGVLRSGGATLLTVRDGAATGAGPGHEAGVALDVTRGRAWVNPPDGTDWVVRTAGGSVATAGNPVAVECAGGCRVEAPAGGADVVGATGSRAHPVAGELVAIGGDGALTLGEGTTVSPWAQANLRDDDRAGMAPPRPDDARGVRASALLDGSYPVRLDVVGPPEGEPLPRALVYSAGETYELRVQTGRRNCGPTSCESTVTASPGVTGTVRFGDGSIVLSLSRPVDCYDESRTEVAVPRIGTTTIQITAMVGHVVAEGRRWRVASFAGTGSISTTLTTACNPGDVLGTSTSAASATSA
ncbi:MAG TPA: hypothetical protein VFW63_02710 [Acidimicrobiales bacterium]|nr:hypothetical protein [Acidimicrobiales bacterium]